MSKAMALEQVNGETCLYDCNGHLLGKYNPATGRGMFAHTFFIDERTCNLDVVPSDNGWLDWVCSACEQVIVNTDVHVFPDYDYCPKCGARVMEKMREKVRYLYVGENDMPDYVLVGSIARSRADDMVRYVPERTCKRDKKGDCSRCYAYLRETDLYCPTCGAKVVG